MHIKSYTFAIFEGMASYYYIFCASEILILACQSASLATNN